MLNQATEAIHSASYVENYLDAVEELPCKVQRYITRIFELDVKHRSYLRDVDMFYEQWANCPTNELESTNATKRNRAMTRIQQSLIAAQEIGDEKLNIVQQLTELIEGKTKELSQNFKSLDYGKDDVFAEVIPLKDRGRSQSPSISPVVASSSLPPNFLPPSLSFASMGSSAGSQFSNNSSNGSGTSDRGTKRIRRGRVDTPASMDIEMSESILKMEVKLSSSAQSGSMGQKKTATASVNAKKKRKKAGRQGNQSAFRDDTPPIEETIDPDEPTYCLCDQISFGEMILCDNDLCPIEWFHFSCVSLMTKPKGKWFCPNCRGDRPNVMKPKAQFLKELERYNKEKEEKT